eukprot:TRINITY_DN31399_c0_g1_i1.p1 TRINITY_DN31399_c0_g1~~TRINITY_DN31399_c0_g1_i1.p1  ORF type:complete len:215 (+),score=34.25 TRINITY_DN31399_c0_g1_i1:59-703(+)
MSHDALDSQSAVAVDSKPDELDSFSGEAVLECIPSCGLNVLLTNDFVHQKDRASRSLQKLCKTILQTSSADPLEDSLQTRGRIEPLAGNVASTPVTPVTSPVASPKRNLLEGSLQVEQNVMLAKHRAMQSSQELRKKMRLDFSAADKLGLQKQTAANVKNQSQGATTASGHASVESRTRQTGALLSANFWVPCLVAILAYFVLQKYAVLRPTDI